VAELVVTVDVTAPVEAVWDELVNWDGHDRWMLLTRMTSPEGAAAGVGSSFVARTGIGPLGFSDSMTITQWDPPNRCVVDHTGWLVRGSGAFAVEPLPDRRSRIVWTEWLRIPFGPLGQLAWLAGRPLGGIFLRISLTRMARIVERRHADELNP
jgi:hypothetical protein